MILEGYTSPFLNIYLESIQTSLNHSFSISNDDRSNLEDQFTREINIIRNIIQQNERINRIKERRCGNE